MLRHRKIRIAMSTKTLVMILEAIADLAHLSVRQLADALILHPLIRILAVVAMTTRGAVASVLLEALARLSAVRLLYLT